MGYTGNWDETSNRDDIFDIFFITDDGIRPATFSSPTIGEDTEFVDEKSQYLDKPERARCDICGKDRTQVRCEEHPKATGCNYCHLRREHRA